MRKEGGSTYSDFRRKIWKKDKQRGAVFLICGNKRTKNRHRRGQPYNKYTEKF